MPASRSTHLLTVLTVKRLYLESIRTGREVTACCSIGDETVCGIPYRDIVEQARLYIHTLGGFERFAEWGLIRHKDH